MNMDLKEKNNNKKMTFLSLVLFQKTISGTLDIIILYMNL